MHVDRQTLLAAGLVLGMMAAIGCDTEVRQQRPPRIPDESEADSDIQAEPEPGPVPEVVKEPSAADKKLECCNQCLKGHDKDRTGDAAENIPCADFTADLDERCRKYFVASPISAAEAKICVAALGAEPGGEETPAEGAGGGAGAPEAEKKAPAGAP
jgi:hypothetical protein